MEKGNHNFLTLAYFGKVVLDVALNWSGKDLFLRSFNFLKRKCFNVTASGKEGRIK